MSYIILAHIFLYTWTHESVTWGNTHGRLLAGRNWPILAIHVHPGRTEVRASSVRELLLVGFLGHARQIPLGYIFWVFPG